MAVNEPPIDGTASMRGGGGLVGRAARRISAGSLKAKVDISGVRSLTGEFSNLLGVLKQVRSEITAINTAAGGMGGTGGMGGVGHGTPTGAAGTAAGGGGVGGLGLFARSVQGAVAGGRGGGGFGGAISGVSNVLGPGGFTFASGMAAVAAAGGARVGLGVIEDRFQRNVQQSIPISSRDAFTASMYSALYKGLEPGRFGASGMYGGTRENQQAAQQIALNFGTTIQGSQQFLAQAGANVQGSGGSLNIAQTAAQAGLFASPMVSNRALAMGIQTYKQNGVLQNPMQVGLEYIKDYEKRAGVTMNEIDFAQLRNPGSGHRMRMKQLYGLSDEAIDMAVNAGMQNMQFRKAGGGRQINFGSGQDLKRIGLDQNVLGLQATRFMTTSQNREQRFFGNQEGSMVDRLRQEGAIQEALADTEDAFAGLLGPMHEFQRVLQGLTTALTIAGGVMMARGALGGAGGAGGLLGTLLGASGGAPGATGAPSGAPVAGGRLAGVAGRAGIGAMGVGGMAASLSLANSASTPGGAALGIAGATASGAAIGFALAPVTGGLSVPVGAAVGFVAGSAFAAKNYFGAKDKKGVATGFDEGLGMTDAELIAGLGDYRKNAAKYGRDDPRGRGQGAGAKQRGRYDVFARRRGALLAAALDEAVTTKAIKLEGTGEAADLDALVSFFGSDAVFDDAKLQSTRAKAEPYITKLRGSEVWRKYFGSVHEPFAFQPVTTNESTGLVMTPEQRYSAGSQGGDPVPQGGDPFPHLGDPISDKAEGQGESWNKLDNRMKERLLKMFRASGGKVWLGGGGGWRSTAAQEKMFLSRYVPSPNGEVSWKGQKWHKVRAGDFAAAPPGRSFHEIGLAADLAGDLGWVVAHAHEFGLRHFADVNNEPHHVQPVELPGGRSTFEANKEKYAGWGTGEGGTDGATTATSTAAAGTTPSMGFGGGGGTSITGIGYSIAAAAGATMAGGGGGFVTGGGSDSGTGGVLSPPAGGEGTLTDFFTQVLHKIGAPVTPNNLAKLGAIAKTEGNRSGTFNPFNYVGGSQFPAFNTIGGKPGVKNYPDWATGVEYTAKLLQQGNATRWRNNLVEDGSYADWWDATNAFYTWGRPAQISQKSAQEMLGHQINAGDGPFDAGTSMMMSGGNANVSINVSITSTGNVNYDAHALGEAVRPVLSNVMAEISTKRGS